MEIKTIKSFMLRNGYPDSILDRVISLFINKTQTIKQTQTNDNDHKQFQVILPYLGSFSKRLEQKIKSSISQHLPKVKVVFIYRAATRLKTLFAFKDKLPSYLSSGIVYRYTCCRCNSTYVGETIRHAKRRFSEHMGVSGLTGKPLKGQNPTAVLDHVKKCKCLISLSDFAIIGRDNISEENLRIKESLFTHKENPKLSIHSKSIPLVLFKN